MAELAAMQAGAHGATPGDEADQAAVARSGPLGWRIGIFPLPLFVVSLAVIVAFMATGKVPADLTTNIVLLTLGGFACAEIGKRIPGIRLIGAAAIFAAFIPSFLVYVGIIPDDLKASISDFTEQSNFLYLFIGAIVVGSILGMDRRVLIGGFIKIFVPITLGSIAAVVVGCGVGWALGLGLEHVFFKIVVPIMAGGVGEGAIPLSIGYATLSGQPQGDLLAEILPSVMFGSLTAVIFAGLLNLYGRRNPHLTGNGKLQMGEQDVPLTSPEAPRYTPDLQTIGTAIVLAMMLYLIGALVQKLTNFPGPVTMLFLTVALKLGRVISPRLEQGAYRNYQFFAALVTYPLLFAIGVAKTPWEKLMSAFNAPTVLTVVATVFTLMATGFFVARFLRLYPIETAIVNACHSGQGGTGDIAILTACNRLQLMPFAQVATRIGGAIMVTIALAVFAKFGF